MINFKIVPFVWGFAEAVFFFIVPDVWLTWLAFTVSEKKKLFATVVWATAGAILGGLLVYEISRTVSAAQVSRWLDYVPGISQALIVDVARQVNQHGIYSVFLGVIKGIPYKLYAAQWGYREGSISILIFCSLLARGGRFFLSVVVAKYINVCGERFLPGWERIKRVVFFIFWIAFYIFYFSRY